MITLRSWPGLTRIDPQGPEVPPGQQTITFDFQPIVLDAMAPDRA